MKIGDRNISLIIETAEHYFSIVKEVLAEKNDQRKCGYLTIMESSTESPFLGDRIPTLVTQIGEDREGVPVEKLISWSRNSGEKALRLSKNPDNCTAWETREFENGKYGGAIQINTFNNDIILSFSGLPEHGDEALVLCIAIQFNWITMFDAKDICKISKNTLFAEVASKAGLK